MNLSSVEWESTKWHRLKNSGYVVTAIEKRCSSCISLLELLKAVIYIVANAVESSCILLQVLLKVTIYIIVTAVDKEILILFVVEVLVVQHAWRKTINR